MVSRKISENLEEEIVSNNIEYRNVNESALTDSYETTSEQVLPIDRIPPDPGELSRNTVDSPPDYATVINI